MIHERLVRIKKSLLQLYARYLFLTIHIGVVRFQNPKTPSSQFLENRIDREPVLRPNNAK